MWSASTMLMAVEVYNTIQTEREWLQMASQHYPIEMYERMVQYSANRLAWKLANQFALGKQLVRIRVEGCEHNVQVVVRVEWGGDRGHQVSQAHLWMCNPRAQA